MSDPAFIAGLCFGLIIAGTAIAIYIAARHPRRRRREPLDWDERSYAPPVTTTIISPNRRREINL